MTDSRDQTSDRLTALDTFLESQRHLLAQTQSDLHKLSQLRVRALEDPASFMANVEDELDDPAFRMSEYNLPQLPEPIDWDLFASHDPAPFTTIPLPGPPPQSSATKQRSPPSELQTFVRDATKTILGSFKPFTPSEAEDDAEAEAEAEAEAADEQRLAELVKCGTQLAVHVDAPEPPRQRRRVGSGLRLKPSRSALGLDADSKGKGKLDTHERMEVDTAPPSPVLVQQRPKRSRKPRLRPDEICQPSPPPPPRPLSPSPDLPPLPDATFGADVPELVAPPNVDASSDSDREQEVGRVKSKRNDSRKRKAPSETFNLPWSLSEQHLLERLLEEIPAGEKQRWAKISKAMAGKRTPRQVASRVQKYFEKLKKFGVGPD